MRWALVVLGLVSGGAGAWAEEVVIPAPGVALKAAYAVPAAQTGAAIVALHGCGGPYPRRDGPWRDVFVAAGHAVLLPDSFGSRGLASQCKNPARDVSPNGLRRSDAVAAAGWLAGQAGTPAGGVVVLGWSNGGSTVLAAAGPGVMPAGLVRGFVAFYPGCRGFAERADWAPSAPVLIIMGAEDDWTPAAPCRALAARFPDRITLVLIPGAYHDFDVPDRPVRTVTGLAFTANGDGVAHSGGNPAGRAEALRVVPAWVAGLGG